MSAFNKGLVITAVPIVVLSAIGAGGAWVEALGWSSLLAVAYCVVAIILSLIFYAGTGERRLAGGMLVGACIGIVAVIATYWWHFHRIGWT